MRVVIAVVLVVVLFAGACGSDAGGGDDPAAVATPLSTPADAAVRMVTSKRSVGAYEPTTLTVSVGDVVEFPNDSDAAHDVDFDAKAIKDSKVYGPKENFKATFPAAGIYPYKCTLHPGMKGTVKVA
jgi:plastocyanin